MTSYITNQLDYTLITSDKEQIEKYNRFERYIRQQKFKFCEFTAEDKANTILRNIINKPRSMKVSVYTFYYKNLRKCI